MEGYVQGALLKELHIPPFRRALLNSYFGKFLLMNFASTWNKLFKHCIPVEFSLVEGYVQRSCSLLLL